MFRDLIVLIAQKASVETRMRMACVSKLWYEKVNSNEEVWDDMYLIFCTYSLRSRESWLEEVKELPQLVSRIWTYPRLFMGSEPHISELMAELILKRPLRHIMRLSTVRVIVSTDMGYHVNVDLCNGINEDDSISAYELLMLLDQRCNFKLDLF